MDIKLNKEALRDKIYACWVGKNIGGTMGAPYEGKQEIQDIHGYNSPKGEPLPNDDLDLQLVWLTAMEQVGPKELHANILADYWLSYIPPHWNEYGTGKSNLKMGLLPPLSGEFRNESWKHSNGAWIRSEIWACLAPGFPNIAIKYAYMDASIDHGVSEGTYGEIFTAALESLAFIENDLRTVIEKALTYIPADCKVAKCVRMVLEEYDKKTPWQTLRQMLVEENADIGWFQAPANIAYVILGLMYGEGDFLQSLIYSINCGDDTDCTGATCGAILGILNGTKGIPKDLSEYIGDRIIMVAADNSYTLLPKTCTELTDRVLKMIPTVLKSNGSVMHNGKEMGIYLEYTDGEDEYDKEAILSVLEKPIDCYRDPCVAEMKEVMQYGPYCFEIATCPYINAVVQYEEEPVVKPLKDFKVRVYLKNLRKDPYYVKFKVFLPEGWTADYDRNVHLTHFTLYNETPRASWEMTIHVGEHIEEINKVTVWAEGSTHPLPLLLPLVLLG